MYFFASLMTLPNIPKVPVEGDFRGLCVFEAREGDLLVALGVLLLEDRLFKVCDSEKERECSLCGCLFEEL